MNLRIMCGRAIQPPERLESEKLGEGSPPPAHRGIERRSAQNNREENGASRGFSSFLSGSPILAASALRSFVIGILELPAINP